MKHPGPARTAAAVIVLSVAAGCSSGGAEQATPASPVTVEATTTTDAPVTTTTTTRPPEWPPALETSTDIAEPVADDQVTLHRTEAVTDERADEMVAMALATRHALGMTGLFRQDLYLHRDEPQVYVDAYLDLSLARSRLTTDEALSHLQDANPAVTNEDGTSAAMFVNVRIAYQSTTGRKYGGIVAAHESVHGVTDFLIGGRIPPGPDGIPGAGPAWLVEGFADHRGYDVVFRSAYADQMLEPAIRGQVIALAEAGDPLEAYATETGMYDDGRSEPGYAKGQMAAELLERIAGRAAIDRAYWEAVPELGWRQAFESSFGMTVEDFYGRFEAWRALGFPG